MMVSGRRARQHSESEEVEGSIDCTDDSRQEPQLNVLS